MDAADHDPISTARIRLRPGRGVFGRSLEHFDRVDSTNRMALEAASAGAPHGHLVIAEFQSAGRGRHGRAWISGPFENILASFVLHPRADTGLWTWIPLAAALAVAEAVRDACPEADAVVKWPNDLRSAGRKLGGILSEGRMDGVSGFVVVGIGLNVNQVKFEPGAAPHAASLASLSQRRIDRAALLAGICDALEIRLDAIGTEVLHRDYEALLEGLGAPATVRDPAGGHVSQGTIAGIDATGRLLLDTPAGRRTFSAGEVSLRMDGGVRPDADS